MAMQRPPDPRDATATASSDALVEVVLAVLRAYGLSGDSAIHAARAVRSALHGFVTLESNEGFGLPLALEESYRRLLIILDRGLAAVEHAA
jgi:hypothetical protein